MIKFVTSDTAHYAKLSALLWKYGRHQIAEQLGWKWGSDQAHSDARDARACARDIEQLGTAYIKLAQIASTREDILPPDYVSAFSRLQDEVEPVPIADVEEIITQGLGVAPATLFASFDSTPLATASVGQVHRATLRDGQEVVVKVRRPGIASEARDQLGSLKRLAAKVDDTTDVGKQFRFRSLVGAVEYALNAELDYRQEANHLQHLGENLASFESIRVPQPIHQLVCSDVLVMEYVPGTALKDISGVVLAELDTEAFGDMLVRAYLQQILVDGLFHADPHPGNLVLHDGGLGLLDGGMVVSLSPVLRREIAAMLLAFSEGEGERAAAVAQRIGQTDEGFDARSFRTAAARVVVGGGGQFEAMSLGRTIVRFLNVAGSHGLVLPFELILLSKAFLQLETTLHQLNPNQDAKAIIRSYTFELLTDRAKEQFSPGKIAATALDSAELASNLPSRLNEFTRLIAENQLRLKVDAFDEASLLAGMRKIANRITSGLIVAATIVGAALMMRVETETTLFGYPLLAMVFFLVSATIGSVLVYNALFSDKH